jgi:hypothetical protein
MSEIEDPIDDTERPRRPVDISALVAGVAVLAFCAAVAFGGIDSLDGQLRVVWPLVLGAVGIALLAGVRRR